LEESLSLLLKFKPHIVTYLAEHSENGEVLKQLHADGDGKMLPKPSVKALAQWKDRLCISDHQWGYTSSVFGLGSDRSITVMKAYKEGLKVLDITPTSENSSGNGVQYSFVEMIRFLLKKNQPKDPTKQMEKKIK